MREDRYERGGTDGMNVPGHGPPDKKALWQSTGFGKSRQTIAKRVSFAADVRDQIPA